MHFCEQVYKEEDTSKMPLELGTALSIEREQIDDPEIRVQALEAIYMIILQVKEMNTFLLEYLSFCLSSYCENLKGSMLLGSKVS